MARSNTALTGSPSAEPAGPTPAPKASEESFKDTFESIIIAFVLAFVFRAYVVEAFVIPTGSMAPTLLGRHLEVVCEQCGYRFPVEAPQSNSDGFSHVQTYLGRDAEIVCPMCHFPNRMSSSTRVKPGDRILVHKYIYSVSEPQRWDVVVFKNPQSPMDNFIKRLAGLPGERLWIIDGNVYVQPLGSRYEPWQIARKSDRPQVQREVWQPIYHSRYVPLDGGAVSLARIDRSGREHPWVMPWVAHPLQEGTVDSSWQFDRRTGFVHDGTTAGQLRFDFDLAERGLDSADYGPMGGYPYNQFRPLRELEPVEDIRLSCLVEPRAPGLILRLQTSSRLDQIDARARDLPLVAELAGDGRVRLLTNGASGGQRILDEATVPPLPEGRSTRVELWYVDQHACLWVAGEPVCQYRFDLPVLETLKVRPPPRLRPDVRISVEGAPVRLHEIDLDRDIYYSSLSPRSTQAGWGTLVKTDGPRDGEPIQIDEDRFFCLGDNSPWSSDGRYWYTINPWIRHRMFHPGEQTFGLVPRQLMIGKAFFVYFPAPYQFKTTHPGVVPNFADMRFIH